MRNLASGRPLIKATQAVKTNLRPGFANPPKVSVSGLRGDSKHDQILPPKPRWLSDFHITILEGLFARLDDYQKRIFARLFPLLPGGQRYLEYQSIADKKKMKSYIQFITTPTADTPGTCLLLHFDDKRYVIGNIHEGLQRAGAQMGFRLTRVHDIFVTGKTEWKTTGGLLGLVITLADSTQAVSLSLAKLAKKKLQDRTGGTAQSLPRPSESDITASKPVMNIHGGPNLMHLIATARRFIFRKGAPLRVQEAEGHGHGIVNVDREPDWADANIQVWNMAITNSAPTSSPMSPRKRSFTEFSDHPDQKDEDQELRRHVISEMFDSSWRMDILEEKPLSEVPGLETAMFIRDPDTKTLRRYFPSPSDDGTPLPDINVLVRKAWPGALIDKLPGCEPSPVAMSYIIRGHRRRGKFLDRKARALGVPSGPTFGRLAKGESVQSQDGNTITPDMVMEKDREGGGVAVIDLPSKEYVENLINRPEWNSETITAGIGAVIWLLGPGVGQDPQIRAFMTGHPQWKHIISSADSCPNYLAMSSSANSAISLNRFNNDIFPIPVFDNNVPSQHGSLIDEKTSVAGVLAAQRGLMCQLEPTFEIHDTQVFPFLNTEKVLKSVPKKALDLARFANEEIASESTNSKANQDLPSGDAEIITLGTGSSVPSKYRNVSATLLRVPGSGSYLLDCGEGTLGQLRRVYGDEGLKEVLRDLKLIWISHLHADHHLGTVSIVKAWRDEVHGQDGLQHDIQSPDQSQDTSPFSSVTEITNPVQVLEQENRLVIVGTGQMINWLKEYAGVEDFGQHKTVLLESVAPWSAKDPRFHLKWDHRHVGFNAQYPKMQVFRQASISLIANLESEMMLSEKQPAFQILLLVNGDCRPCEEFVRIGKGSTVLLHEATFDDERQGDAEAKKHSTISEAIVVGMAMRAKRIVLTHFSQRYQKIPIMKDMRFVGVSLEKMEEAEESDIPIVDIATADLPTRASEDDSLPQNNDTTETNSTLGNVVGSEPSGYTEDASVQSMRSPKKTPEAKVPTSVNSKSESFGTMIPPSVTDIKVCVAFDYMRVKVKDIAHMEKYAPALIELFKQDDTEDNVEGISVERVSDEIAKKGKKRDESDDEDARKEDKKKSNGRINRDKSAKPSQRDKEENDKNREKESQNKEEKGQEEKGEGKGREEVGQGERDRRESVKGAADTNARLLDDHKIFTTELPLETHVSANIIPLGDRGKEQVQRRISMPENSEFIVGHDVWHDCIRSSFGVVSSRISRAIANPKKEWVDIWPDNKSENVTGIEAQGQEGTFSVVTTNITMYAHANKSPLRTKLRIQGHLANSGVPIPDSRFLAKGKFPIRFRWPKPVCELPTGLRNTGKGSSKRPKSTKRGASTRPRITRRVSSLKIRWEIEVSTAGLTRRRDDGQNCPRPVFDSRITGREASAEERSSLASSEDLDRFQEQPTQETSIQKLSRDPANHPDIVRPLEDFSKDPQISDLLLRTRAQALLNNPSPSTIIRLVVRHPIPKPPDNSPKDIKNKKSTKEEKGTKQERATKEEKVTTHDRAIDSLMRVLAPTSTSPPQKSASYSASHGSQAMKQPRSGEITEPGWRKALERVALSVEGDVADADHLAQCKKGSEISLPAVAIFMRKCFRPFATTFPLLTAPSLCRPRLKSHKNPSLSCFFSELPRKQPDKWPALIMDVPKPIPPAGKKLTGRAFYESIGSPKMILAPMVDQSEFAWRILTRSFITPQTSKTLLAYTPMFHGRLFTETAKFRNHHFQPIKAGLDCAPSLGSIPLGDLYLDGNPTIDRPLFVQFCANSPDDLLQAAEYVQPFCDAVDLNLGCPQGIAKKGHYGAFLQEDWDLIYKLINKLHLHLHVPVTAKMRILETKEETLEYAKMILSAGASIITVHGRRRDQKGHQTGLADWSVIRYLREKLPPETVIFANGNILRHEDIQKCLDETNADGVMSAEGNLHDPTIFAEPPAVGEEGREYWRGRDGKGGYRMDAVFRRYMDIMHRHVLGQDPPERRPLYIPSDPVSEPPLTADEDSRSLTEGEPPAKRPKYSNTKTTSPNLLAMQPHLFHLLRPLVAKHTDIRDVLARSRGGDMAAFETVLSMVEAAVKDGLVDYNQDPDKYDEPLNSEQISSEHEKAEDESSVAALKACKRPWWICQPYVRPLPKEALEKGSLTMGKKGRKQLEKASVDLLSVRNGMSEREKVDRRDGMPREEMPKESQVCG